MSIAEESYLRIAGGIVAADGRCVVGRTIFAHDDLHRLVTLLTEDGVESTRDGLLLIIRGDDDGYHGRISVLWGAGE